MVGTRPSKWLLYLSSETAQEVGARDYELGFSGAPGAVRGRAAVLPTQSAECLAFLMMPLENFTYYTPPSIA